MPDPDVEKSPDVMQSAASVFAETREHFNSRLDLFTLTAVDKISATSGSLIFIIVGIFIAAGLIVSLSISIAILLSRWRHSQPDGFFIVGAAYGILMVVCFFFRRQLFYLPLIKMLLKKIIK